MPRIRIECEVPFMLALPDGDYSDGRPEPLHWEEIESLLPGLPGQAGRTRVGAFFTASGESRDGIEAEKAKQAKLLISRTNRLIRWYRVVSADTSAFEVSIWQASPFTFNSEQSDDRWNEPLLFSPPPQVRPAFFKYAANFPELSEKIKEGFSTGNEPPVSGLFLLDARQALDEGRFREAVLFSWSTIDATFNIFFGRLADRRLAQDWSEGIKFVKGIDFGLRQKMSVGLNLLAGKSLFAEPGGFWTRLSQSYDRRNKIIHEGQVASEDDARASVTVAEQLVEIVNRLAQENSIVIPN